MGGDCGRRGSISDRPPDGRNMKATAGDATPLLIVEQSWIRGAVVGKVNWELWELLRPLEADCGLAIKGVLEGHLGGKVCWEGSLETGFYCDPQLENSSFSLGELEERCRQVVSPKLCFTRLELPAQDLKEVSQTEYRRAQDSENAHTVHRHPHTYAPKHRNCPAHWGLWVWLDVSARNRHVMWGGSWQELPQRWAGFGVRHRNELSGATGRADPRWTLLPGGSSFPLLTVPEQQLGV
ncbi:hypothetical protein AAFF_G00214570 [Aldrovandia affinis]|uniref:Uncharacterized protein n=1 Tax=Aldrovandia affinis TaxID=143900 RepID=A0AAD7RGS5_9TELE|nr:hypothetical protein AAFF_G00214570 [Aldrovandia affinis]